MKRSTFSALSLSAFSALMALSAIAPAAQAFPELDPAFKIQSLRLREFDARNKSGDYSQQPYYPQSEYSQPEYSQPEYSQPEAQPSSQTVSADQDSAQAAEPTAWETPKAEKEEAASTPSITARRHQLLDRN